MWKHQPSFIPQTVCVVGCGGTGSRLIPLIAQFIKTLRYVLNPEILVVDDDVVEDKNLLRQNFVRIDVDKKKAEVIANRYSKAFDIPIQPLVERISADDTSGNFRKIIRKWAGEKRSVLLVMCVDNPNARRDILQIFFEEGMPSGSTLVVDTGNENDFGQVKVSQLIGLYFRPDISTKLRKEIPYGSPVELSLPFMPLDVSYFGDMTSETSESCADLDQTMAINALVATTAFSFIQSWYYNKPITYHRIDVTLSHGNTPHPVNGMWLSQVVDTGRDKGGEYPFAKSLYLKDTEGDIIHALNMVRNFNAEMKAKELAEKAKEKEKSEGDGGAIEVKSPGDAVVEKSVPRRRGKPVKAKEEVEIIPVAPSEVSATTVSNSGL